MTDEHEPVGRGEAALVLGGVVVVVAVLVLVVFVLIGGRDETVAPRTAPASGTTGPTASASGSASGSSSGQASGEVIRLTAPGASGRCLPPSAQALAQQDLAFDATVETVSGPTGGGADLVTLRPTRFYAGDEADEVEVRAPGRQLTALLDAPSFREGDRYLIAASGGQVAICGLSAPYSPSLQRLYEEAYG